MINGESIIALLSRLRVQELSAFLLIWNELGLSPTDVTLMINIL
jgi:hypothetical protein